MNLKRIAASGLVATMIVGASAAVAGATTASGSSSPSSSTTCLPDNHDDTWPLYAQGRPDRDPGVRVWHDAAGWHVRVTHNTIHDRVFSGEIVTKGALVDVHAVKLERNDDVKVGPNGHAIVFRFNNYGGEDGFDFRTRCAPSLEFGFVSDGHAVPTDRIAIGATDRHPAHNPFVIARTA
jgi:hypothetical protein